jgi:hemerythrin-like domain-containing protein
MHLSAWRLFGKRRHLEESEVICKKRFELLVRANRHGLSPVTISNTASEEFRGPSEATLKRHDSLHPLSQHHHDVLVAALQISRASRATAGERQASLRRVAEGLLRFWESSGKTHFREEEEVLLPAYARRTRLDRDADVMRMLADHAQIRASMETLQQALATDRLDVGQLVELGQLLHDHVRLEENVIFPRIEQALTEDELQRLAPHLTRHEACPLL